MNIAPLALLEEKDYDYITVKEICKKAGVNRSTFYLHYETIDDLLTESLSYLFSKFTDKYGNNMQVNPRFGTLKDLYLITPDYIMPYLEFLSENRRIFMTAINKPTVFRIKQYFDTMCIQLFNPILERFHVDVAEQKYILAFYISGMHAIIIEWLKSNCSEPMEFIANLLVKYTLPYKGDGGI